MKKIIIICNLVLVLISCNSQKKEEKISVQKNEQKVIMKDSNFIDFEKIQFDTNIVDLLSHVGLTINDNELTDYNISGDYEEFKFPVNRNINLFFLENKLINKESKVSLFYFKKNKKLWCYEFETVDDIENENILKSLRKKTGMLSSFEEKTINTKEHPIFLDETGEFKKDHIVELKLVYENPNLHCTFFVINTTNFSKKPKENLLKVYAIDKTSSKYKEWVEYRSFNMFYKK